jgi:NADH-quinone oxidoreductase subunit N
MAGIPPLAGFFGKYSLFALSLEANQPILVVVGVITSVISMAYYLRILVSVYMIEPVQLGRPVPKVLTLIVLWVTILLLVAIGVMPDWVTTL